MSERLDILARRYAATLRKFVSLEQEADLEQAYALSRSALAEGCGVLDMARIHHRAFAAMLQTMPGACEKNALRAARTFLLESLSPFEATHRGFSEANAELRQLVAAQEKRNAELADINRKLASEIQRRQRTEKALRQSELHFRKLFNEARIMEENLRDLSNQVLNVQEDERKRISRELHDEAGQALTAISVTLAGLSRNGQPSAVRHRLLRDAQHLLQDTMETLHDFARELRPASLDELGLLPALRSYLKAFARRTQLRVQFAANPIVEKLGDASRIVLFRVVQESLTNVAKHACANRVEVAIRKKGSRVCMTITDDGKSFGKAGSEAIKRKQRLGLLGMQERVRLVNGEFSIRPLPRGGTVVEVLLPLKADILPGRRKKITRGR